VAPLSLYWNDEVLLITTFPIISQYNIDIYTYTNLYIKKEI